MARAGCRYKVGHKLKVGVTTTDGRRVSQHALRSGTLDADTPVVLSTTLGGERVKFPSTAGAAADLADRPRNLEELSELEVTSGSTARASDTYRLATAAGADAQTAAAAVALGDALASAGVDPVRAWEAAAAAGVAAGGVDGVTSTPAFTDARRAQVLLDEHAQAVGESRRARAEAFESESQRLRNAAEDLYRSKADPSKPVRPTGYGERLEWVRAEVSRLRWEALAKEERVRAIRRILAREDDEALASARRRGGAPLVDLPRRTAVIDRAVEQSREDAERRQGRFYRDPQVEKLWQQLHDAEGTLERLAHEAERAGAFALAERFPSKADKDRYTALLERSYALQGAAAAERARREEDFRAIHEASDRVAAAQRVLFRSRPAAGTGRRRLRDRLRLS